MRRQMPKLNKLGTRQALVSNSLNLSLMELRNLVARRAALVPNPVPVVKSNPARRRVVKVLLDVAEAVVLVPVVLVVSDLVESLEEDVAACPLVKADLAKELATRAVVPACAKVNVDKPEDVPRVREVEPLKEDKCKAA